MSGPALCRAAHRLTNTDCCLNTVTSQLVDPLNSKHKYYEMEARDNKARWEQQAKKI